MNNKRLTINNLKGFTLIELLVVIAIIGILATFIVASFANAQARSRDARRKSDLDALKKALLMQKNNNTGGFYLNATAGLATTYIETVPQDPSGGAYTFYAIPNGCTNPPPAAGPFCTDFRIVATLEAADDQIINSQNRCQEISPPTPASWSATQYVVCPD